MARHLSIKGRGAGLLVVGCGNGDFVRDAASWAGVPRGLDPDPNAGVFGQQFGLRIVAKRSAADELDGPIAFPSLTDHGKFR